MFDRLKQKIFPCENLTKTLMEGHDASVRENSAAHLRLLKACAINPPEKKPDVTTLKDMVLL